MIFHKYKLIFVHIPKSAGSSINRFYADGLKFDWKVPNYEFLYGWCPKRNIHLQHATSNQLLELGLIDERTWNEYFKFTIVRNPWDRSYSDYHWIKKDTGIRGKFEEYIFKKGPFKSVLNDKSNMMYRGDHLVPQTDFFSNQGQLKLNYVGRFEDIDGVISRVNSNCGKNELLRIHEKKNKKRFSHYSSFYTDKKKGMVESVYQNDIDELNYSFDDKKRGLMRLKNLIK